MLPLRALAEQTFHQPVRAWHADSKLNVRSLFQCTLPGSEARVFAAFKRKKAGEPTAPAA
jgi:hypothetical protein